MGRLIDTLLLLALPASGKSEVRRYLAHQSPEESAAEFHLGPTVQLDDFPYVHFMRCVDDALEAEGAARLFFEAPERSFFDPRDWGTLIELINQDYEDLKLRRPIAPASPVGYLFERLDQAGAAVGIQARLSALPAALSAKLIAALAAEAERLIADKLAAYPDTLEGKTLVIEFARGGAEGSPMPIPTPRGYAYSLGRLSPELLDKARILYIWVTPEESRRKNEARANPDDPGSILHHGVPEFVMRNEYGADDIDWLESTSAVAHTVSVEREGVSYALPIARVDNRRDRTSFVREPQEDWPAEEEAALHAALKGALDQLAQA